MIDESTTQFLQSLLETLLMFIFQFIRQILVAWTL